MRTVTWRLVVFMAVIGLMMILSLPTLATDNLGRKWASTPAYYKISYMSYTLQSAVRNADPKWDNAGSTFRFVLTTDTTVKNDWYAANYGSYGGRVGFTLCAENFLGRITQCNSRFNTYYSINDGSGGTYDAESIALHEFGHWLELYHHYDANRKIDVMYGILNPGDIKRILSDHDKAGIRALYP